MQNGTKSIGWVVLGVVIVASWLSHAMGQPDLATTPIEPTLPKQELPPGCLQVVSEPGQPLAAVVYDPQQQVLGVYHVDRTTGEIALKSIRQIRWDLQMQHYGAKEPLPEFIKNGLEELRRQ